jgi:hypothetical protein
VFRVDTYHDPGPRLKARLTVGVIAEHPDADRLLVVAPNLDGVGFMVSNYLDFLWFRTPGEAKTEALNRASEHHIDVAKAVSGVPG